MTSEISNANFSASMSNYSEMTLFWNFSSELIESWNSSAESIEFWKYSTEKHSIICMIVSKFVSKFWFISIIDHIIDVIDAIIDEVILLNEIIIHRSSNEVVEVFRDLINDYSDLFIDIDFANFSEENWMRISLKIDWESRISDKTKIYSLDAQDKTFVDAIFDQLHEIEKLSWTENSTSFSYFVFCVWKIVNDERKSRVIVNIWDLNVITQSDVYSLSRQTKMIFVVMNCQYITIIDCSTFFYQWRVHSTNKHKLIVVSHREQKSFNVAVMSYKNSFAYVQR